MQLFAALGALTLTVYAIKAQDAMVVNYCRFQVYLRSVSSDRSDADAAVFTLNPSDYWSHKYEQPSNGGVSVKIARQVRSWNRPIQLGPITQLEYTYRRSDPLIWFDASNVDCNGSQCPFFNDGMLLSNGNANCPSARCDPGANGCSGKDIYWKWDDNLATKSCTANSNIMLFLCSPSGKAPAGMPAFGTQVNLRKSDRIDGK